MVALVRSVRLNDEDILVTIEESETEPNSTHLIVLRGAISPRANESAFSGPNKDGLEWATEKPKYEPQVEWLEGMANATVPPWFE